MVTYSVVHIYYSTTDTVIISLNNNYMHTKVLGTVWQFLVH